MTPTEIAVQGNNVSRIGFGCWQLAGDYDMNGKPNGYGTIDGAEAIKALHMALENGINFFDTAIGYGYGRSEEVLGAALRSAVCPKAITPVICTKFGMVLGSGSDDDDFSAGNIVASVEGSLKRLQTECIDILLLHNPPDNFDFGNYDITPFQKLADQGKIKTWGVSCRTQKGVANVLSHGFGSVIEAVYNPLDRRFEQFFADKTYKDRYTFICRVPLASGFISARTLTANPVFPANDIRHNFNSEQVEWVSGSVRKLAFLNDLEGGIVVSALRFQLSNPYNTLTIPGLKNTRQVNDALMALRLGPLPDDVIAKITEAVPEVFYKWRG